MTHPLVVNIRSERCEHYVARPSVFGSPFSAHADSLAEVRVSCVEEALFEYEKWLLAQPELVARVKAELRGKTLGCWCSPSPCHADILARIANED